MDHTDQLPLLYNVFPLILSKYLLSYVPAVFLYLQSSAMDEFAPLTGI